MYKILDAHAVTVIIVNGRDGNSTVGIIVEDCEQLQVAYHLGGEVLQDEALVLVVGHRLVNGIG